MSSFLLDGETLRRRDEAPCSRHRRSRRYFSRFNRSVKEVQVTSKVFFDITTGNDTIGRIVIGLFGEIVPKTVKNFMVLSVADEGSGYKGSKFDKVIFGYLIQGGGITSRDGTGGSSIYGGPFPDENFTLRHTSIGLVGMANSGRDTNTSKFYITSMKIPWMDGRNVIFGKVVEGMDVVREIESKETDRTYRPIQDIIISDCGLIKMESDPSAEGETRTTPSGGVE